MQIKHKSGKAAAILAAVMLVSTPAFAYYRAGGWHDGYYHGGGYYHRDYNYGYYNGVHRYYNVAPVVGVGVVTTGVQVWVPGHYRNGFWVPGHYVVR